MKAIVLATMLCSTPAYAQSLNLSGAPPPHPLPQGRLSMVGGNTVGINFIEVDASSKSGSVADVWTYRSYAKPFLLKGFGKVVADTVHQKINCSDRTVIKMSVDGYDERGTRVIFLPPARLEKITAGVDEYLLAGIYCGGVELPPQNTVVGYVQAEAMARYMFDHHLTQ